MQAGKISLSVIIPTYNRCEDLNECLSSIIIQTRMPKEIIIVDDSDNNNIYDLVEGRKDEFKHNGVALRFIKNPREKSLAIARNVGIEESTGDVILFLDDDVVLDSNYIEALLNNYEDNESCLGVQGYVGDTKLSKYKNLFARLLFINHFERNSCRVMPSMCITYPHTLEKTIPCQWLFGANHSYRRSVFSNLRYDENLKRYSYKEDQDLSYRVYKMFPGSLYIEPAAKLVHKDSPAGRMPNKKLVYMKQIYDLYLFYKDIDQKVYNKSIFLWSRLGLLIQTAVNIALNPAGAVRTDLVGLKYLVEAYVLCLRYKGDIKSGDLDFFNRTLYKLETEPVETSKIQMMGLVVSGLINMMLILTEL